MFNATKRQRVYNLRRKYNTLVANLATTKNIETEDRLMNNIMNTTRKYRIALRGEDPDAVTAAAAPEPANINNAFANLLAESGDIDSLRDEVRVALANHYDVDITNQDIDDFADGVLTVNNNNSGKIEQIIQRYAIARNATVGLGMKGGNNNMKNNNDNNNNNNNSDNNNNNNSDNNNNNNNVWPVNIPTTNVLQRNQNLVETYTHNLIRHKAMEKELRNLRKFTKRLIPGSQIHLNTYDKIETLERRLAMLNYSIGKRKENYNRTRKNVNFAEKKMGGRRLQTRKSITRSRRR